MRRHRKTGKKIHHVKRQLGWVKVKGRRIKTGAGRTRSKPQVVVPDTPDLPLWIARYQRGEVE
jgi:hypothetical protein